MRYVRLAMYEPDIVEYDAPVPGVRMTATEARVYARRLIELADELAAADAPPAQPIAEWRDISGNDHALSQADAEHQPVLVSTPPAQPDDERVQAIRERVQKTPDEELFVKGNYTYWLVRGKYTGQVVADVPFVLESGQAKEVAAFIAAAPTDIRYLLARLDAVQAERDALQAILKPIAALYEQYLEADLDEMSSDMFVDWLDDGEVQGRVHKAMSAAFRTIGYQHTKESDYANA